MAPTPTKIFTISGIVQGVGYRYFASAAAGRHKIMGFARNLPDGRVEVLAEGEPEAMLAFRQDLERGPVVARVDKVIESDPGVAETFTAFSIL